MGDKSLIEWCDSTWNPLAAFDRETGKRGWFCTKVSEGCTNCYAETLNKRLGTGHLYRAGNLEKIEFRLVNLDQPIRWRRPRRVFVNSMTDLFHEAVPDELIRTVFGAMSFAGQHAFQILTKRPDRMADFLSATSLGECQAEACEVAADVHIRNTSAIHTWPLPNVWLGTSVEHQRAADERIPHLLRTPAAVRFLSCEPLLGPINLSAPSISNAFRYFLPPPGGFGELEYAGGIDWVIVGGESGPHARGFNVRWARLLIDQCRLTRVPVFVKQLGARPFDTEASAELYLRAKKGGSMKEWPEDIRVREFPAVAP